jgi:hypothetical protein
LENLIFALPSVDDLKPARFFSCNGQVTPSYSIVKSDLFQFKAALFLLPEGLIPLERSLESDAGRAVEKNRHIRFGILRRDPIECID